MQEISEGILSSKAIAKFPFFPTGFSIAPYFHALHREGRLCAAAEVEMLVCLKNKKKEKTKPTENKKEKKLCLFLVFHVTRARSSCCCSCCCSCSSCCCSCCRRQYARLHITKIYGCMCGSQRKK